MVRAGLLHQLKMGQRLAGSEKWPIFILHPGEHPLKNLAFAFLDPACSTVERAEQLDKAETLISKGTAGLERLISASAGKGRVVLVVDQFEEIFTLCKENEKCLQFFNTLLKALPLTNNKLCLIITMRADFFSKCAENGAMFCKDESLILTWSFDYTARLWDISADYDFPKENLPLLVEVITGTVMDDYGNVTVLDPEEWLKRKQEYIKICKDHLKTCKYKKANLYLKQKQAWKGE